MSHEYKGIGVRFGAQLIDGVIVGVAFIILIRMLVYVSDLGAYGPYGDLREFISGPLAIANQLVVLNVIVFLYFFLLEGFTGTTVGKKVLKTRVIREDGRPCGLVGSLIRNLLRLFDALPFFTYLIAIIFISRSSKKQRLGDRLAHTVVVGQSSTFSAIPPPHQSAASSSSALDPGVETETKFCTNCGAKIPASAS